MWLEYFSLWLFTSVRSAWHFLVTARLAWYISPTYIIDIYIYRTVSRYFPTLVHRTETFTEPQREQWCLSDCLFWWQCCVDLFSQLVDVFYLTLLVCPRFLSGGCWWVVWVTALNQVVKLSLSAQEHRSGVSWKPLRKCTVTQTYLYPHWNCHSGAAPALMFSAFSCPIGLISKVTCYVCVMGLYLQSVM